MAVDLVFDGLTRADPSTGELGPALATWESSEDLREWTFFLEEAAVFADGSPIRARDVAYSLERIAAPGDASLRGVRLEVIEGYPEFVADPDGTDLAGIEVADEHTLVVTTSEPFAELPAILSDPIFGVVPEEAVEAEGTFADEPVGSGPFAYVSRTESAVVLEAAEGRDPVLDGVQLFEFDSSEASYASFEAGELDLSLVPSDEVDVAGDEYGDDRFTPFLAEIFFAMNLADDTFDDERLREAIVLGADRLTIVEEWFGANDILDGLIPVGVSGSREGACGDTCSHDPERARELIEDAYPDGDVPTIALDYNEDDFPDDRFAEELADQLDFVGIPGGASGRSRSQGPGPGVRGERRPGAVPVRLARRGRGAGDVPEPAVPDGVGGQRHRLLERGGRRWHRHGPSDRRQRGAPGGVPGRGGRRPRRLRGAAAGPGPDQSGWPATGWRGWWWGRGRHHRRRSRVGRGLRDARITCRTAPGGAHVGVAE
ncbi:MAG: ABC transporter substrate-binding protein [Acidimicrobiia bacterium]|nr:ABC transporter substrate-binding protein [Acidimicrobiia bacterium]